MNDVIIEHLVKSYNKGSLKAVNDVSFNVAPGELFGLIGPDGAGKSSIFRMLTTLLLPDSGKASVGGMDIVKDYREIRKKIGYMPGKFSLYQDLSVSENIHFFASLFNTSIQENYDLIKNIYEQIEPFKTRRAGKLSGGMKQKLALCCALIHRPTILFLDEPTTGVDSVSRKEFWEMLQGLKSEGITVLVSTPYMDEANLCERIALIQNGQIMSIDTPEGITKQFPQQLYAVKGANMSTLLKALHKLPEINSCYAFGEYHHITFCEKQADLPQKLRDKLNNMSISISELKLIQPTIEDCFIKQML